ncbi:heparinase II/III family protein [Candidatus Chloroploca asiatica]|uniref:heparinase II/III family protein n=1 Tax=Candidatus Chloroploca asiatica TaxID=1506545 RepID=UPI000BEAD5D6|nr:heparinase II/III family protein [Candidatus Chloroploca asiatica]
MSRLRQLSLLLTTMRYLTPSQIWHRGRRLARQRWLQYSGAQLAYATQWQYTSPNPLFEGLAELDVAHQISRHIESRNDVAREIAEGRFLFLHQTEEIDKIGWHSPTVSQLWRYQLHYFNYVQDLLIWECTDPANAAYATFRQLVRSWNDANQAYQGDGWHPYTIALRSVNWLHAIIGFKQYVQEDDLFRFELIGSLYTQAQYLFRNLELDVRGNHLLENIRALCWLGIAFDGSEPQRWYQRGIDLLTKEIEEQVLEDGGHFERTPGYHLVVLKDLLEIALWLKRNHRSCPDELHQAIHRMLDFLLALLPQNGLVPLFKDTAWDISPNPFDLLNVGAIYFDDPRYKLTEEFGLYPFLLFGQRGWDKFQTWPVSKSSQTSCLFKHSGWALICNPSKDDFCIIDVGKPCPDYLPAHAHADLLSYELTIDGQRIIVDSGVYEYTRGHWRDYFRSTRAHNTVEINATNQSDVWSSFRVAHRAQPDSVFFHQSSECVLAQASHNGYCRQHPPVTHRRTIVWCQQKFWLFVDELWGDGKVQSSNHIHLHPDVDLQPVNQTTWQFINTKRSLYLLGFGHDSYLYSKGQKEPFYQGWYSEKFGNLLSNQVLTLQKDAVLSCVHGYGIFYDVPGSIEMVSGFSVPRIVVSYADNSYMLELSPQVPPVFL